MSDWTGALTPITAETLFCSVADMAAFLQITIAADNTSALEAIHEATGAIQEYCQQQILQVEDDEYTFDVPARCRKLFLPELPVTEVAEVVEDDETLVVKDDYKLGRHGILQRVNGFWTPGIGKVTVTYTHGYAEIPEIVADICKRAAARAYQAGLRAAEAAGVSGIQAMSLGDYSVQYGSEQSGGVSGGSMLGASAAVLLMPSEKQLLSHYRLVRG